MDSATWCRTPAAASAARRLRPEVSKNSSTALSSNEGELARSITTCVPAMASLSPSPVMLLTPLLGEAATTSWPPWRRMATVFEPISPVPPMTTIFMVYPLVDDLWVLNTVGEPNWCCCPEAEINDRCKHRPIRIPRMLESGISAWMMVSSARAASMSSQDLKRAPSVNGRHAELVDPQRGWLFKQERSASPRQNCTRGR